MNLRIYKYALPQYGYAMDIEGDVKKWLKVENQKGYCVIWALVDTEGETRVYTIQSAGTGYTLPKEFLDMEYLGTCEGDSGYIWHYFLTETRTLKAHN